MRNRSTQKAQTAIKNGEMRGEFWGTVRKEKGKKLHPGRQGPRNM